MKPIWKMLFVALACGLALNSCKKNAAVKPKPAATYTVLTAPGLTFSGNDTTQAFNTCDWESLHNSDGSFGNSIRAYDLTPDGFLVGNSNFTIIIITPAALKIGETYISAALGAQNLAFSYADALDFGYGLQVGAPTGKVRISELTSSYIKGTFSVKIWSGYNTIPNPPSETITKGEFYWKLVN